MAGALLSTSPGADRSARGGALQTGPRPETAFGTRNAKSGWLARWRRGNAGRRPRLTELFLLLLAAGVALTAPIPLHLGLEAAVTAADLRGPVTLVLAFAGLHVALSARGSRADEVIAPTLLALMGLNLAFSRRLAPALDERQFAWLLLGAGVVGAVALGIVPLRLLRRYRYSIALAGTALVAATLVFGRAADPTVAGPRLWLGVGPLQFQPSELLKLVLVVFLAGYLADRRPLLALPQGRLGPLTMPPWPYLAPLGAMLGLGLLLVAAQRDLGAALLLYLIGLGMLYLASGRAAYVLAGLVVFLAGAFTLHRALPLVQLRTAAWLDPWSDAAAGGYQIVQALMAMGAGGIAGTGIGQGMPTVIPAVHTDFVFAAVVEELGVAGALAVLALYGTILWRGMHVALHADGDFAGLLAAGLTLALTMQTVVIVGGILRLTPLTGITLPFLSHGGTSLVTSAAGAGLLLLISDQASSDGRRRGGATAVGAGAQGDKA